ncbi:restriction endonuclease [Bacteroides caecigallinarum]|uniref:restriction endonuclease n=1 Tax=Bacteroides caecigallinarum TaxID=1411144 RepID=UPI001F36EDC5|nr:restriction endonuclease [Bacteroides caecigallinarum]MCF2582635.1 restriction endonuclease [Bacteroides caecigallinarum]
MRILIEEYQYNVTDVKDTLYGIDALENVEGKVSVHYVGYYYNTLQRDCVFILPKVLLMDDKSKDSKKANLVFGKYRPEEILDLDEHNPLTKEERDFVYKFAVWIYRAIVVYKDDKQSDIGIVYHKRIQQVGSGRRRRSNTYLDILLTLIRFAKENQSFFFYIVKNMHSGLNKINWTRTIAKQPAIIQENSPIYLNPANKKRQINFDEELLVIFFSILNYIGDKYGFTKNICVQFPLIKGQKFEAYLNGYGCTRLRQIKYKYFSDKAIELWELCFAFFDESRHLRVSTEHKEYLLVKNFYIVFEAIIDELIGDKPLPDGMDKKQEDGKVVDHLFTAQSLIDNEDKQTYYIGDSKYYKMGHELGSESIYKQYTYARNVIQWNLDIFLDNKEPESGVRLRDDITEGYNIIPNFFVSAMMNEKFDYADDGIVQTHRENKRHKKTHYENRLFDRDTLLLFHYDVNFLYVLSLYARDDRSQKNKWKQKVRRMFRKEIQEWLQQDYSFYAMRAKVHINGEEYIKQHFKELIGKVYTPYTDETVYSLALDRKPENIETNQELIEMLRTAFYVEECRLGQDPNEVLPDVQPIVEYKADNTDLALCIVKEGVNFDNAISTLKRTGTVGVALQMNGATLTLVEGFTKARYLLIHNKSNRYELFMFDGTGPTLVPKSKMQDDVITTKKDADLYLTYKVKTDVAVDFGKLNLLPITRNPKTSYHPQLIPIKSFVTE